MSQQAPESYTPQWSVVSVTPRVDVAGGTPVNGHLISFMTKMGNRGEVFIPDTVTDLDVARAKVASKVTYVDGLATLGQ